MMLPGRYVDADSATDVAEVSVLKLAGRAGFACEDLSRQFGTGGVECRKVANV